MALDQHFRENAFRRCVLARIEAWSTEQSPIVLWDIDDTLGKVVIGAGVAIWKTRPCVPELFQTLSERFPSIRHGILSDRLVPEITAMLGGQTPLGDASLLAVERLVDAELIFSANEALFSEDQCLKDRFEDLKRLFWAKTGIYRKLAILQRLRETEMNVHLIDDLPMAAEIPGGCPFALYVGDLRPIF